MTIAVYPGSFDPITNGHVDIVKRALKVFDYIVVAVATNSSKKPLFSVKERTDMLARLFSDNQRVKVDAFDGLLVDYMKEQNIQANIRGLRAVSDFEYEFQMAHMNRKLYPEAETFFLMTGHRFFYVSSRMVKEVASLGGCFSELVPPLVHEELVRKMGGS